MGHPGPERLEPPLSARAVIAIARAVIAIALLLAVSGCVRAGFEGRALDMGADAADQLVGDGRLPDGRPLDWQAPDGQAPDGQAPDGQAPDGSAAAIGWVKRLGGSSVDIGSHVAVDASGNVFVTGIFEGKVNFGGSSLSSVGGLDIFLVSFTAAGVHRWSKHFGGTGDDSGNAVAVDGKGNVYITGDFKGSANFGGNTLTSAGFQDIFVASFTAAGVHRWSKHFGSTYPDYGHDVTVDSSDRVYVTGNFKGTATFGGSDLTSVGSWDVFLTSFTAAGVHRWSRRFGSSGTSIGYGLATSKTGELYLCGTFQGAVNFGGGALTTAGSWDIFLASFTAAGLHRWSRRFGGTQFDESSSVTVDTSGHVFITGYVMNKADFGGGSLSGAGAWDIFVASFTSAGVHRWSRRFGGAADDQGYQIAADSSGNVFVTGYFENAVKLGGSTLTAAGKTDVFVASFTSSGTHRWSRRFGGAGADFGIGLAVGAGFVYATGYFSGLAEFGGTTRQSAGALDIFLIRLAP